MPEDLYGIFTENAIVLVGGEVGDGGAFRVMQMGWPPPEPRCVSPCACFGLSYYRGLWWLLRGWYVCECVFFVTRHPSKPTSHPRDENNNNNNK